MPIRDEHDVYGLSINRDAATNAEPHVQPTTNNQATSRKRVLIVEDNEDIRLIFSYAFNQKFEVQTATNGRQALDMIERNLPDLLVLDVNMPELSGIDVLNALHEHQVDHHMKIIVATGNAMAAMDPIMDYADMTLVKPVSPSQLVQLAERLLSGN